MGLQFVVQYLQDSSSDLGRPRGLAMVVLSLKFGWLGYPQDNAYLDSCIQTIYIGKKSPDLTLLGLASMKEFQVDWDSSQAM